MRTSRFWIRTSPPALVTRNHAYLVYDFLYGIDDAARPHPQMAAGHVIEDDGKTWKITLREGLHFHDGEKVLARDAVASLNRWAKRDVYAISLFNQLDKLSAISDDVLQFRLKRPFRLLADLLGKPNPFAPAIMPERLALSEPSQQVKEIIGSGPYKFVMNECVPGSLAVYERNAGYVPRTDGPPVGSAGPKIAYFERSNGTPFPTPRPPPPPCSRARSTGGSSRSPTCCLCYGDIRTCRSTSKTRSVTTPFCASIIYSDLLTTMTSAAHFLAHSTRTDMMTAVAGEDRSMWTNGCGLL